MTNTIIWSLALIILVGLLITEACSQKSFKQKIEDLPDGAIVYLDTPYVYLASNNPTNELGLSLSYVKDLVKTLAEETLTAKELDRASKLIWSAYIDPLHFDKKEKEFSKMTMGNMEEMGLGSKPYLAEWSNTMDEKIYFCTVLDHVLTYYNLISYGDTTEGVEGALKNIKQTNSIKIPKWTDKEYAYSYLFRLNNTVLKDNKLIALITKGYYDIWVCKITKEKHLTALLKKVGVDLVEPQPVN